MKLINKILLSALLLTGVTSCDSLSDFGDINVNPGAATSPVHSALLTGVQVGLAGNNYDGNTYNYAHDLRAGLYAQYFSETQYTDVSRYSAAQVAFVQHYSGPLMDLQNIIDNSENNNMEVIATILQQYIYLNLTNRWGDLPYSQALQGVDGLLPVYDRQEDIYKGIFQKLGEAVNSFDDSPINGDVIFGGNIGAWRRTANSIKLLAAIQLSKKVPSNSGFAAEAFREALAATGGVITTNAQSFVINHPGGNFQNPYFANYLTRQDYAQSSTMTDLLTDLGDDRQTVFGGASNAAGSTSSSDVGVPYGLDRGDAVEFIDANPTWARVLRGDKRNPNSPFYLITASQVALVRAEAADLGWTTESVSDLYAEGIRLSFEQWDVAYNESTYLANSGVALGGSGTNAKQIATQRWIASYPDGAQGWNIWRKSGYPELTPSPDPLSSSGQIPRRYQYNQAELQSNPENVEAAIANIPGGNTHDARVWWDQD